MVTVIHLVLLLLMLDTANSDSQAWSAGAANTNTSKTNQNNNSKGLNALKNSSFFFSFFLYNEIYVEKGQRLHK